MLFDTTVRRELARSFGATLVVLLTIVLTMGLVRTVGAAAQGQRRDAACGQAPMDRAADEAAGAHQATRRPWRQTWRTTGTP